jgi:poly(beta-D-mannuronate) lyase
VFTGAYAKQVVVSNAQELEAVCQTAQPGDSILLANKPWQNIHIKIACNGTKQKPIVFTSVSAEKKVLLTGNSTLAIGGSYIIVNSLEFSNGFAGDDAVITFRLNKQELANNCRVTNCSIIGFNNSKKLDENYWVAFYGKNNRLDHCNFQNKLNIGVLLAVILDDNRSRENQHLIDHNYFGIRKPLASNGGEIIRVGVSEHCQFNSKTVIENNFFEHCDGETEIISIKSGENIVRKNIFKECQGSVVLRHGDYNTVESNIFLGNRKVGTGGVRIINKGQRVINNLFFQCQGEGFRSPIAIMNGILNSPANRYVAVTDAVVANNCFFECSPLSFGVGNDEERNVVPKNVLFENNIFYNQANAVLFNAIDSINGIKFFGNIANAFQADTVPSGFALQKLRVTNIKKFAFAIIDELKNSNSSKTITNAGLVNPKELIGSYYDVAPLASAKSSENIYGKLKNKTVTCKTVLDIQKAIQQFKQYNLLVNLTENRYDFSKPIFVDGTVCFTSSQTKTIRFVSANKENKFAIYINAGSSLSLKKLNVDFTNYESEAVFSTDTSGNAKHANFSVYGCNFANLNHVFFKVAKTSLCDSIVISNSAFKNYKALIFALNEEQDKKGYYNTEQLRITNCSFEFIQAPIIEITRSGKDESTMGPTLTIDRNKFSNCETKEDKGLINLLGVQHSSILFNQFKLCNKNKTLINFEDNVAAKHQLYQNSLIESGRINANKYVVVKK